MQPANTESCVRSHSSPSLNRVNRKRQRLGVLSNPVERQLYHLIIQQLHHDGYLAAASAVSDATGTIVADVNQDGERLKWLVATGLSTELTQQRDMQCFALEQVVERYISAAKVYTPLQLSQSWSLGRRCFKMQNRFTSASVSSVLRDLSFSPDGSLVACSGTNGLAAVFSLMTIEDLTTLDDIRASNSLRGLHGNGKNTNGVRSTNEVTEIAMARRFRDHAQHSVEVIRFHPTCPLILTGGRDGGMCLRSYEYPDSSIQLQIYDNFPVRGFGFHPSGEYAVVATDHPVPRLTNLRTGKVLSPPGSVRHSGLPGAMSTASERTNEVSVTPIAATSHSAGLTSASFSPDGRTLVTTSLDGSWILYDGVSGRALHRAEAAHSSVPVTSAAYSRTGNVLLTAGMDSTARLWDLRRLSISQASIVTSPSARGSARDSAELMSFGEPAKCNHRSIQAIFSHDESHILCQDNTLFVVQGYCVYSGDSSYALATQPSFMQRALACSPFSNMIVTGADDCKLRLWTPLWLPS
ncbi:unnamed protein product [Phytomonas sp. EM1]|nr:unnamed protein product [Phytomonas sp. EM1]|eukprot:CCW63050.1 unnamed protein product [Phytomonas sp. isolate EM1]